MTAQILAGKKILMVIARKNFRDEEYFIPREIFQQAGLEVTTASSKVGATLGVLGGEAEATLSIKEIQVADFDAVVFVGGDGAQEYFQSEEAHRLAREFQSNSKIVGAICIAPVILSEAGVLQGKTGTVWQSILDKTGPKALQRGGCALGKNHVEQSGNIITADGREASEEFARAITRALADQISPA